MLSMALVLPQWSDVLYLFQKDLRFEGNCASTTVCFTQFLKLKDQ